MISSSQLAALGLISTLALGVALGAPFSSPPSTTTTTAGTSTTSAGNHQSSIAATTTTTSSPPSSSGGRSIASEQPTGDTDNNRQQMNAADSIEHSGDSNQVDLGSLAAEIFDGKNPFADDSLWQIPIHLVRDLTTAADGGQGQEQAAVVSANNNEANENNAASQVDEQPSLVAIPMGRSLSSQTLVSANSDLKTAAGYHYPTHGGHHYAGHDEHHGSHHGGEHYGHGDYFQYVSVPKPYAWEFGYRRGNPYHTIERYEHGKGPHFKTKVKWSDKKAGYGVHVWDYNHDDHHHQYKHHHDHYDQHDKHHGKEHHGGAHYGHH